MPLVRKWRRLGFTGQLAVLLSVSLVIIAGLVISIVALASSNTAGKRAVATANCVNDVLQNRNGPSAKDAAAHITYAAADQKFSDALAKVLTLPPKSQAQRDAYRLFVKAARDKKAADDIYVRVLTADQKARNAKPFGKC